VWGLGEKNPRLPDCVISTIFIYKLDAPVKSQIGDLHENPAEKTDPENILPGVRKYVRNCSFT
jgi:hypothetical protein